MHGAGLHDLPVGRRRGGVTRVRRFSSSLLFLAILTAALITFRAEERLLREIFGPELSALRR